MSSNITRGGMNTRLDPDVTGSRCAKPDPGCPTRLSAKVLISSIVNYFTVTVPFTLWVQSLCGEKFLKIATLLIAWLPIGMFLQTSLKILRSFANPHRLNLTQTHSWFQLTYLIPDPNRFSRLVPPLNIILYCHIYPLDVCSGTERLLNCLNGIIHVAQLCILFWIFSNHNFWIFLNHFAKCLSLLRCAILPLLQCANTFFNCYIGKITNCHIHASQQVAVASYQLQVIKHEWEITYSMSNLLQANCYEFF